MNVYLDNEPFVCDWLRNLIKQGSLADGEVLECDIRTLPADALRGRRRVHLFAGIGGWEVALQLAGWPDDLEVWTASCPCQPFSVAGSRRAEQDERHLWPVVRDLIEQCQPAVVFGEQVASKLGREWLVGVRSDLEALGYVVGAADLCVASCGAPHIRQRLWWGACQLADLQGDGRFEGRPESDGRHAGAGGASGAALGDTVSQRLPLGQCERRIPPTETRSLPWEAFDLADCIDGKTRRVKPGIQLLAHGIRGRLVASGTDHQTGETWTNEYSRAGALRGFGNAIVPQVAAEFIKAFMECVQQ